MLVDILLFHSTFFIIPSFFLFFFFSLFWHLISYYLAFIFWQGSKEKTPALSMTMVEDGQYAVDFHAQLSTLQAFSMCISILHGTETSVAAAGQERNNQLSQCNSLKVLKEEVKFLIEAVTEGEKKEVAKRVKKIQPSYVLDPPFSPIARV